MTTIPIQIPGVVPPANPSGTLNKSSISKHVLTTILQEVLGLDSYLSPVLLTFQSQ
ncbi:hypothetical protein CDAR_426151, partial [Caerostris darwini]